jgi:hypothetical protein
MASILSPYLTSLKIPTTARKQKVERDGSIAPILGVERPGRVTAAGGWR